MRIPSLLNELKDLFDVELAKDAVVTIALAPDIGPSIRWHKTIDWTLEIHNRFRNVVQLLHSPGAQRRREMDVSATLTIRRCRERTMQNIPNDVKIVLPLLEALQIENGPDQFHAP